MWSNYGKTFIEYAFLNFYKNQNMHVVFENEEITEKIKINKKKVIFISGHFANFGYVHGNKKSTISDNL